MYKIFEVITENNMIIESDALDFSFKTYHEAEQYILNLTYLLPNRVYVIKEIKDTLRRI